MRNCLSNTPRFIIIKHVSTNIIHFSRTTMAAAGLTLYYRVYIVRLPIPVRRYKLTDGRPSSTCVAAGCCCTASVVVFLLGGALSAIIYVKIYPALWKTSAYSVWHEMIPRNLKSSSSSSLRYKKNFCFWGGGVGRVVKFRLLLFEVPGLFQTGAGRQRTTVCTTPACKIFSRERERIVEVVYRSRLCRVKICFFFL